MQDRAEQRQADRVTVHALWSTPRSRSTAFFRSMLERGDITVVHEPFFDLHADGRTEIDGAEVTSADDLLAHLVSRSSERHLFFKETTDHRYEAVLRSERLLTEARHAFLIRRPEDIVASYHAVYPDMKRHEVGVETLHELYRAVVDAGGHQPVVIDSDDLVAGPAAVMAAYCEAVDLPFLPDALTWTPEDRPEWQRTSRWHHTTASSSGFEHSTHRYRHTVENSKHLAAYAAHHRPFYDALHTERLRVDTGDK